jgi:hypothetical protein
MDRASLGLVGKQFFYPTLAITNVMMTGRDRTDQLSRLRVPLTPNRALKTTMLRSAVPNRANAQLGEEGLRAQLDSVGMPVSPVALTTVTCILLCMICVS